MRAQHGGEGYVPKTHLEMADGTPCDETVVPLVSATAQPPPPLPAQPSAVSFAPSTVFAPAPGPAPITAASSRMSIALGAALAPLPHDAARFAPAPGPSLFDVPPGRQARGPRQTMSSIDLIPARDLTPPPPLPTSVSAFALTHGTSVRGALGKRGSKVLPAAAMDSFEFPPFRGKTSPTRARSQSMAPFDPRRSVLLGLTPETPPAGVQDWLLQEHLQRLCVMFAGCSGARLLGMGHEEVFHRVPDVTTATRLWSSLSDARASLAADDDEVLFCGVTASISDSFFFVSLYLHTIALLCGSFVIVFVASAHYCPVHACTH